MIELDTAIDRLDMNHLNTLADCIEEEMPDWFESRYQLHYYISIHLLLLLYQ